MLTSIKDLSDTYMHLDNKYGLNKKILENSK